MEERVILAVSMLIALLDPPDKRKRSDMIIAIKVAEKLTVQINTILTGMMIQS